MRYILNIWLEDLFFFGFLRFLGFFGVVGVEGMNKFCLSLICFYVVIC